MAMIMSIDAPERGDPEASHSTSRGLPHRKLLPADEIVTLSRRIFFLSSYNYITRMHATLYYKKKMRFEFD
jgi:hypothetical protein